MAELITWAEVRVGDVVRVAGVRWEVTARVGDTSIALRSEAGVSRGGQPDPAGKVEVIELAARPPDPEPETTAAVSALRLAGLKPEPVCRFWDGIMKTHCGAAEVRPYIVGYRCGAHSPGKVRALHRGRKPCRKCGQPVPSDAVRPEHCLACGSVLPYR